MTLSKTGEITLFLAATLTIMVGTAVAPGLSNIAEALGVTAYAPLLITLPALGAILFAPIFGKCIDGLGPRKTLLICLFGYFIMGAGGALLYGPFPIALDRILLGGFAAGIMAAGTAEISCWYTGKARLNMIAKQGMAIELGGVIFLFISGLLSELAWHGPFMLYFLGLICAIMCLLFIPSNNIKQPQSKTKPQIPKNTMGPIMMCTFFAMILFFSIIISLPGHLTTLGFSSSQIGNLLAFISLIAVFAAMFMPRLVAKTSEGTAIKLAFISYGIGHLLFASSTLTMSLIAGAVFAGIGFGFSLPLLNHKTVEISSEANRGHNLSRFAIAAFSGQFATSALEVIHLPKSTIFYVCAFISVLCILILVVNQRVLATTTNAQ
ncbi:MFS transporter [Alteromonas sp. C1M14]|uniref:MFS transporter n=1 Tax=Alteromonas sp. C1M14 TaxID=2841567 RepID=UPI001C09A859|nr:MFS transporter [Alteromonas sp. C1M14]MBU2978413.1 MFS transporter [Alteromonas sp. C1M14]